MFALLALLCFVLALFGVSLGSVDLTVLGLCFVAAHLLWAWTPWAGRLGRN
jgi:hypothetical protein